MLKKKILVVGGTGFIGFHLIKKLNKTKFLITCLSLNKVKSKNRLKDVRYIFCDTSKKNELNKKVNSEYDYIVNLSGNIDHFKKKETYRSHYLGFKNLVDIFKKKKIEKFIQIGSSTEYGFEKSPQKEEKKIKNRNLKSTYSKSKLKSTIYGIHLYKKNNFPITILRIFLSYGPGQKSDRLIPYVINSCLNDLRFDCSKGNQIRDFIYVDDVVNLIIRLLKNKKVNGEIFNVGSGKPVEIKFIIKKIVRQIKKGYPNFGSIKLRKDEPIRLYANTKKVKALLKWSPKIELTRGLYKTIEFYRNNKN